MKAFIRPSFVLISACRSIIDSLRCSSVVSPLLRRLRADRNPWQFHDPIGGSIVTYNRPPIIRCAASGSHPGGSEGLEAPRDTTAILKPLGDEDFSESFCTNGRNVHDGNGKQALKFDE
jgi:hypothetical protein